MSIRALLVALVLVPAAVAGCVSREDPPAEEELTDADAPAPTTPTSTSTSTAPTSSAPTKPTPTSPSPAKPTPTPTSAATGTNDTATPPPGPETVTVEGDFRAAASLADPINGNQNVQEESAALTLPRAGPVNGTLTATWEVVLPNEESMAIQLVDVDGNVVATASGGTPLVVEIPGAAFGNATELLASLYATTGASPMPAAHFVLTVHYA